MGVTRGFAILVVGVLVVGASGFATAPGGIGGPTMATADGGLAVDRGPFADSHAGISAADRLDGPDDTIRAKIRPTTAEAAETVRELVPVRHDFGDVVTADLTGAQYRALADEPDVAVAPVQRVRLSGDADVTVTWVEPTDGDTVGGTVSLAIDASATNDTVERVGWRVDGGSPTLASEDNGTWTDSWDTTTVDDGTHELTARAETTNGSTATASIQVTVDNTNEPPQVSWVEPADGDTVSGDVPIAIDASDPDGTLQAVQWQVDDGSPRSASYNDTSGLWEATWNASAAGDGDHALTADAADDEGATATATIAVTVDGNDSNEAPVVGWQTPADGEEVSGEVTLGIAADDSDGTVESVQWRLDGGDATAATYDDSVDLWTATWNASAVEAGTHELTAEATDDAGSTSSATIAVSVVDDNEPPQVAWDGPADGDTVDGTVTIRLSASDPDGTVQDVQWRVDDGEARSTTEGDFYWTAEWDTTTVAGGTHELTAAAVDEDGAMTATTIAVTVDNSNSEPTVSWRSPQDGQAVEGSVQLQIEASDPDGEVTEVGWMVEGGDGRLASYDEDSGYWVDTIDVSTVPDGTHTILTRARDDDGATANDTISVTVDSSNEAPTVTVLSPDDGATVSGDLEIRFEATDPDGSIEEVGWEIAGGDIRQPSADGSNAWVDTFDTTQVPDGTYDLAVGARDDQGAEAMAVVSVTVENGGDGPTISWVSPSDGASVSGTVALQLDAAVPGGSIERVAWKVDDGQPRDASHDAGSGYWESTWDASAAGADTHELTAAVTTETNDVVTTTIHVTVGDGAADRPTDDGEPADGSVDGDAAGDDPNLIERGESLARPPAPVAYGVRQIYGDGSIARTSGGGGVTVAVLDTGVDGDHPDLRRSLASCTDVAGTGTCEDRHGHGTHVAGTAVADGGWNGLYGVAPDADLRAYKVLGADGTGHADDVAAAIHRAADEGADVVVLSASTEARGSLVERAIEARSDEVLVVAAAGNDGPDPGSVAAPAASPTVVAVGALDRDGAVIGASARGPRTGRFCECDGYLELVAAGEAVPSTWTDGYRTLSGTSAAAPHVAGVAAKVWASGAADRDGDGTVTPAEVRATLRTLAVDVTQGDGAREGYDPASGHGVPVLP